MSQLARLERNYRIAFLRYLPNRDESALHHGYQIGRAAMTTGLSLLDLAQVHHRVLVEVLRSTPERDLDALIDAAAEFVVEVLATYELAQRRFLAEPSQVQGKPSESANVTSEDGTAS